MNLTQDPIPKLIRQIAFPASVGFFFNTMYNIVDTWYASISDATIGQAALTFSFPVFLLIISLSSGLGNATSVLIANALGEDNMKKVHTYYQQSIGLLFLVALFGTVFGLLLLPYVLSVQGAIWDANTLAYSYLQVIIFGLIFFLGTFLFNNILTAQGDTKSFRNMLIIGFFLNFIFNSLFLFGGLGIPGYSIGSFELFIDLGFPQWNIAGIALSTVCIQAISMTYLGLRARKTLVCCPLSLHDLKPNLSIYKEFFTQWIPAAFNMMIVSIGILVIQAFVGNFGEDAVAGYGVAMRIEQIALLPTIGLNIAVMMLMGQNNGAKKYSRLSEVYATGIRYGMYVLVPMWALLLLFGEKLMRLFPNTSEQSVQIGSTYLDFAAFLLIGYMFLFLTTAGLQGIKKPFIALAVNITRQVLLPLPLWYLCVHVWDLEITSMWWVLTGVIWLAAVATMIYMKSFLTRKNG